LDVDFRLTGEKPRRGMELHGNITVWTNAERTRIHRLMFLSYAKLLDQPDRPLAGLKELPARQRAGLLKLAKSDPVNGIRVVKRERVLASESQSPASEQDCRHE
jgi:hypothetical protein